MSIFAVSRFLFFIGCILLLCETTTDDIDHRMYFYQPLCGSGDEHRITYILENFPPLTTMTYKEVQDQLDISFGAWTRASNSSLRFVPAVSKKKAHIIVSFKEGKHKCVRSPCLVTEAFPESNHVLAHTFNPSGGSEVHMNARVLWLKSCDDLKAEHYNYNHERNYAVLKEILTHEIGHAIGIKHLKGEKTIMHSGYAACTGMSPSIGPLDYHVMEMIARYCNQHSHHRHSPSEP